MEHLKNKREDSMHKVSIPEGFDWEWYLKLNHDLLAAGMSTKADAVRHWMRWGFFEGRPYEKPDQHIINRIHTENLDNILEKRVIDYDHIRTSGTFVLNNEQNAFINFIIPVRGRSNFIQKTIESVKNSACEFEKETFLKVNITICEHSELPEHQVICLKLGVDYIWIESGEKFNKCLAMNTAAFFTPKTKWLLFHDIDCIVKLDFFINVFKNIEKKKCEAIQTFSDRRVLYLDDSKTDQVLKGLIEINKLIEGPGIKAGVPGAPGGSICVTRSLFFKIGGYDPYYFVSYAPEDIFFWRKAEVYGTFETCTSPRNEIYHLNHPRVKIDAGELMAMEMLKTSFEKLLIEEKLELLNKMKNNISKYE